VCRKTYSLDLLYDFLGYESVVSSSKEWPYQGDIVLYRFEIQPRTQAARASIGVPINEGFQVLQFGTNVRQLNEGLESAPICQWCSNDGHIGVLTLAIFAEEVRFAAPMEALGNIYLFHHAGL
jgi:hypothetical protein